MYDVPDPPPQGPTFPCPKRPLCSTDTSLPPPRSLTLLSSSPKGNLLQKQGKHRSTCNKFKSLHLSCKRPDSLTSSVSFSTWAPWPHPRPQQSHAWAPHTVCPGRHSALFSPLISVHAVSGTPWTPPIPHGHTSRCPSVFPTGEGKIPHWSARYLLHETFHEFSNLKKYPPFSVFPQHWVHLFHSGIII